MSPVPPSLATASLFFACASFAGCSAPLDANLLRVHELSPSHVDPATRLQIAGTGFPAGRSGLVSLHGVTRRPGELPVEVSAEVGVRALSTERLVFDASEALIATLGGRGTFEGSIGVEFPSAIGDGRVTGALDGVVLDLAPGSTRRLEQELSNRQSAEALLRQLGVVLVADTGAGDGLGVDGVVRGGPGYEAGILKGDRITAIDGVRVTQLADLAPPPGSTTSEVLLNRPGESAPVSVTVAVRSVDRRPGVGWAPGAWLVGAILMILLFLAPTARLTGWLVRALGAKPQEFGLVGQPPTRPWARRMLGTAMATIAAIAALGVLPFSAFVFVGGVDVGVLLMVVVGARIATCMPSDGRRLDARKAISAVSRALVFTLPTLVVVASVVATHGALRLQGVVVSQGGWPWDWHAFAAPLGLLAFVVFLAAMVDGVADSQPLREGEVAPGQRSHFGGVVQVAGETLQFVMAGLATSLFLGGWALPGVPGDPIEAAPMLRVIGTAAFVAKSLLLLWLARRIRNGVGSPDRWWRWGLPAGLLCLGASVLHLVGWGHSELNLLSGPPFVVLTVLIALYAAWRTRRIASPMESMPSL